MFISKMADADSEGTETQVWLDFGCAISLVGSQTVKRKNRVPLTNHAVAFDFGEDGGGGDRSGKRIPVDDRSLRQVAVQV